MTNNRDSNLSPADRVHDVERILHALRQAVQEALLDHKRAGNPVAIWQDERVVWIQPQDIPVAGQTPAAAVDDAAPRDRGDV